MHPVFKNISETLQEHRSQIAIIDKHGKRYNYDDLRKHIAGTQQLLNQKNIGKGNLVLIAVPMSFELYFILEAVFANGAVAVFLDPWLKGKKMNAIIRQIKPDLMITTTKIKRLSVLLPATWSLQKMVVEQITPIDKAVEYPDLKDEDLALITFTSGTSGVPKGAVRTYGFIHGQEKVVQAHLAYQPECKVELSNFPVVGLGFLAVGKTLVIPAVNLMKIHKDPIEPLLEQITKNKVDRLVVSPILLERILDANPSIIGQTVKGIITGGGPIALKTIQRILKLQSNGHLLEAIYGSTEAEPICLATFQEVADQMGSGIKGVYVGKPVDEIQVKIINLQNGPIQVRSLDEIECKNGVSGEIIVSGDHVNKAYYKNEAAFLENKIRTEDNTIWHRTGDVGYMENGALYIVGRQHRVVTKDQKEYHPFPIEQVVMSELNLNDVGYIQQKNGIIEFHYHTQTPVDEKILQNFIRSHQYPVDQIIFQRKPLPRDERHRTKLQLNKLQK